MSSPNPSSSLSSSSPVLPSAAELPPLPTFRPFCDRINQAPNSVVLDKSFAKTSRLTREARHQIMLDRAWLIEERLKTEIGSVRAENESLKKLKRSSKVPRRDVPKKRRQAVGRPAGEAKIIAEHYGVAPQTINAIFRRSNLKPTVSPIKPPGRPSQMTPTKRSKLLERYNEAEAVQL